MRIRAILILLSGAFCLILIGKWCLKQTDGFQITRITSSVPAQECWAIPSPNREQELLLDSLLEQPFTYLSKGGQAYAFISKDQTIVLKLFKMHRFYQCKSLYKVRIPGWIDLWRIRLLELQKNKLRRAFNGNTLAYTLFREETGMLYLNLNANPALKNKHVILVDKLHISHRVSLEHIPFSLQIKVEKAFPLIASRWIHHDQQGAKHLVREMFHYFNTRKNKRLIDLDGALRRNMGILQEKVVSIDSGGFALAEPELCQAHFLKDVARLRNSLNQISPELALYLDTLMCTDRGD